MNTKMIVAARKKNIQTLMPTRKPVPQRRVQQPRDLRGSSVSQGLPHRDAPKDSGLGHDFSRIQVYSDSKAAELGRPCPLASPGPKFCPFGGSCHTCPRAIQTKRANGQPALQASGWAGRADAKTASAPANGTRVEAVEPGGARPPSVPSIVHEALRSPGKPIDSDTRVFMESRLGSKFSGVRVHTDNTAEESARAVGARAYTVGWDVVFGRGEYAPDTVSGKRLLAHELTHVTQQCGADHMSLQRQGASETGGEAAEDKLEQAATEAENVAEEQKTPVAEGDTKKAKPANDPCTRTILAEGTCADLVAGSKWICCDPDNGIERKGRTTDVEGTSCPGEKFTPIFTCDSTCGKALEKGCDDNDNWMAIPPGVFDRSKCGGVYTICANGKQKEGYVRDRSISKISYEVSPGIQTALGVTVGDSFKGAVYRPGAKQELIDKDPCCKSPS